ncbi:hypothetical protein [Coxiella-like endosymbiont]|uniref:hypothetical protein n=1 Tax=Coxiella-like endosymbiont TaxID=1592897 RepID=UPI00272A23BE|nr:hypothetical protein [Coxiella-like endosymbiont]
MLNEPQAVQTLKFLGTVGEPIDPEVWVWLLQYRWRKTLSYCRHMVVNRNRRYYDCRFSGEGVSHAFKTWICDICFFLE